MAIELTTATNEQLNEIRRALLAAPSNYELKTESFSAVAGNAYGVDTSAGIDLGDVIIYGPVGFSLSFFGPPVEEPYIAYVAGAGNDDGTIEINEITNQVFVDFINDNSISNAPSPVTAELKSGASGSAPFAPEDLYFTFGVTAELPETPSPGQSILFFDSKGSWASAGFKVLRNGNKIEGQEVDFTNSSAGTFFSMVYLDEETGWRLLMSGVRPINIAPPEITGTFSLSVSTGVWTGTPTTFSYQWQRTWRNLEYVPVEEAVWSDVGTDSPTYIPNEEEGEGKYLRVLVTASNSNGASTPVSSVIFGPVDVPDFPMAGNLAFWALNNNGSNALDVSDSTGNGYDLTNTGGVDLNASGVIQQCAESDGSNYLSSDISVAASSTGTIAFWINYASNLGNNSPVLIGFHPGLDIILDNDGYLGVGNFQGSINYSNFLLPIGLWTHIAIVFNGGTWDLYVNGSLNEDGITNAAQDVETLDLFCRYPWHAWSGRLDAVGVWNRALSEQEVALLYANGDGVER